MVRNPGSRLRYVAYVALLAAVYFLPGNSASPGVYRVQERILLQAGNVRHSVWFDEPKQRVYRAFKGETPDTRTPQEQVCTWAKKYKA
jgi:hypothetical protein